MSARHRRTASTVLLRGSRPDNTANHTTNGEADRGLESRPDAVPLGSAPTACRPDLNPALARSAQNEPTPTPDSAPAAQERVRLNDAAHEGRCPSPTIRSATRRGCPTWQQPRLTSRHDDAPTTASDIVAALALPASRSRSAEPVRPLPLTELHRLPRDTSMLYGIGPVDASGRVSERHIIHALEWKPGKHLDIVLIAHGLVIHATEDGPLVLPATQRLVIPVTARRHCDIETGDHVLLAAACEYGIVIVHTLAALDDMLVQYHAPSPTAHDHGQS